MPDDRRFRFGVKARVQVASSNDVKFTRYERDPESGIDYAPHQTNSNPSRSTVRTSHIPSPMDTILSKSQRYMAQARLIAASTIVSLSAAPKRARFRGIPWVKPAGLFGKN